MMEKEHIYVAIDLKSFYASIECMERQLDPMKHKPGRGRRLPDRKDHLPCRLRSYRKSGM